MLVARRDVDLAGVLVATTDDEHAAKRHVLPDHKAQFGNFRVVKMFAKLA